MKKTMYLFMILTAILISGCSPSESAIQTAMAETNAAMPTATATETILPTATITNTPEPTATPTNTPTVTPTFTATPDLRIVELGPEQFLLEKGDLPQDAKYYLPNQLWISPHHNEEVVGSKGREEGLAYIEETGRIDGWYVIYNRGSSVVRAPQEIFHNIIQYATCEGAMITIEKYPQYIENSDYVLVETDHDFGVPTVISKYRELQPGGEYMVTYIIESVYHNYQTRVGGSGYEKEFDLDYVIMIAEIALEKLKEAPLIEQ